jgi:hypothetical protein
LSLRYPLAVFPLSVLALSSIAVPVWAQNYQNDINATPRQRRESMPVISQMTVRAFTVLSRHSPATSSSEHLMRF